MIINSAEELQAAVPVLKECMSKGCTIILNHYTYCGHCTHFMPEWKRFETMVKGSAVKTVRIEGDAYRQAGISAMMFRKLSDNNQMYFPMVLLFVDGKRYMYNGQRTAESLKEFVKEHAKKTPPSKKSVAATDKPKAKVAVKPKMPIKSKK